MPDAPVPPALTPEEWNEREVEFGADGWAHCEGVYAVGGGPIVPPGDLYVGTYNSDGVADGGVSIPADKRHALAALALYQQPYGFTHEDVQLLRDVSGRLAQEWMGEPPHPFAAQIDRLADRLAALLPPEEVSN